MSARAGLSTEERAKLHRLLVEYGAYQKGDFLLASGRRSHYYIDIKRAITRPDVLDLIARGMAPHIETARIAGVELAAVPIAAAVSLVTKKPFLMVRKAEKPHGTKKMFEGELRQGETVTFVEDVTTTGGSVLKGVNAVEAAGGRVVRVVVVVDRGEGAAEAFASRGLELVSIADKAELNRLADELLEREKAARASK